jgi:two-component system, cell cycle response regulator
MKSDWEVCMDDRAAVEPSEPSARERSETPRTVDLGEHEGTRRPDPRDRSHCTLTVIGGGHVGMILTVGTVPVVLGRGEPCELRFDDASISFVHAQIERGDEQFFVRDMNSTNGTFVNGVPVTVPRVLADGDRIQLGRRGVIRVALGGPEDAMVSRRLYERAVRDRLTGLYNRSFFDERLEAEHASAWRHGVPLALIMADIDHFKKINDVYGHPAGDEALRHVGQLIRESARREDIPARYGGEEVAILARGIDLEQGLRFAERLRVILRERPVHYKSHTLTLTASFGVAVHTGETRFYDPQSLVTAADGALYRAKRGGRDCVKFA